MKVMSSPLGMTHDGVGRDSWGMCGSAGSMLISRTPVRVSFCGGGSDLAAFYEGDAEGGAVTSMALQRYLYVTVNHRFDDDVRVSYSRTEVVDDFEALEHDLVREAMRMTGVTRGVEITTIADVPSRGTGLGSSSALTVGLLNALHRFAGQEVNKATLAAQACEIEIDVLGQPIGKQDQWAAALGGMNTIRFRPNGEVEVEPLVLDAAAVRLLADRFTLVHTGLTRRAADVLAKQSSNTEARRQELTVMRDQAFKVRETLEAGDLDAVGEMLAAAWALKRSLVEGITGESLDSLHDRLVALGATGAKLLGAGGGGFFLVHGDEGLRSRIEAELGFEHRTIPLLLDDEGTKIIFDDGGR